MSIRKYIHHAAFVTGAAQGLGKAFSEALLQRGTRVCMTDMQVEKGKKVEQEFQGKFGKDKVMFLECDVLSPTGLSNSFQSAVSKFGYIDLMVNNAGIADESKFERMININLISLIRGTMLALEHMRKDKGGKGGRIINVSSTAGLIGVYISPNYCASKFGVVGFHKSVSENPHNIEMGVQYGCLCPAFTDTPILKSIPSDMEAQLFLQKVGINTVESVVQGFMELVDSDNCNGDIVSVTTQDGVKYHRRGRNKPQSRI